MNTQNYFRQLEKDIDKVYSVAEIARAKGFDPESKVEIPLAKSLAEKSVMLTATVHPQLNDSQVIKRILELEKEYGKLDVAVVFKIAEEIAKQKFCKFKSLLDAIDAGIRLGFAYNTLGVVSSPIEGFTELKLRKTRNGEDYFVAYFSGPIRSAGTTAGCIVLMLIDYLREMFGYAKYDPSEEEVKRYVTENADYHERITNLQYFPTEEEISFLAKNLPIQISGEPTERLEVSNYKNLDRVETNFIRGGMCLIFSEGLAQKAAKGFRMLGSLKERGFTTSGWDFLEKYVKIHEKRTSGSKETSTTPTYIKDLVAGRPVFGHPSKSGAFRFRYGRGRVSGFSAASFHPATMAITDGFIATGTQLKIEKPTKGCVATSCDKIDGPIVKLINGSVKRIKTKEEAKKIYSDVEEILYLGDILFPFSDVVNRNAFLLKPGYVEEWWALELQEKDSESKNKVDAFSISFEEAIRISREFKIPLHPKFSFYWSQIREEEFFDLVEWMEKARIAGKKIILPFAKEEQEKFKYGKRALELLGVEHDFVLENVVVTEGDSKSLFANFGIEVNLLEEEIFLEGAINKNFDEGKSVLEIVNTLSEFEIKDKAGDFIGARMGRPEKAKLRKLTGSPNVLFPVGKEGGRLRSLQAACEQGRVTSTFPIYYCRSCGKETIYSSCEQCGEKIEKMFYCYKCGSKSTKICREHGEGNNFCNQSLNVVHYFEKAREKLKLKRKEVPSLIKGVRGTSSENHTVENLSKGILRALHNLSVNKDGTIRFDATELPITAFKPKEIRVSVEKLSNLGYDKDIFGKELRDENQILELMPHDVILPSFSESFDEKADDVFVNVCNFVDELLERFYGLNSFYNLKSKEDLIGQIGVCMAPHNCAGVICRFIGFSNTLGLMASPYMHAAIRRDCDGDEAAVMLLGDVLLNFSKHFLPGHRGGTQDAPLVLNAKIDAGEVDDQILDFELISEGTYPLELYKLAEKRAHSSEVKSVDTVKKILKRGEDPFQPLGFTHDTNDFNKGVVCSSYKLLATMQDKVNHQMELVEKIRAADASDTARLILERHFIRDMRGNLAKFSAQTFRCVSCNEIMRRPPLSGVCPRCNGKIIFTINEGGIKKYLNFAVDLAEKYNISIYLKQNIELVKRYIESVFGRELEKQEKIEKWF